MLRSHIFIVWPFVSRCFGLCIQYEASINLEQCSHHSFFHHEPIVTSRAYCLRTSLLYPLALAIYPMHLACSRSRRVLESPY